MLPALINTTIHMVLQHSRAVANRNKFRTKTKMPFPDEISVHPDFQRILHNHFLLTLIAFQTMLFILY